VNLLSYCVHTRWACSAVGSAPEWHSGGHQFDPGQVHQTFISGSDFPQVAEGRCGYAGFNKAISVERDSIRKEQLLEPLTLVERRLHPQIGGARQNPFCERQDAFYVEFIDLAGVRVMLRYPAWSTTSGLP
jgi:hypothetical protein